MDNQYKKYTIFQKIQKKKATDTTIFWDVYYFKKKHVNGAFREKLIDRKYLDVTMFPFTSWIGW